MMAPFESGHHLLTIPDELLISVISNLDLDALLQTVLVCKHLSDLAEPFLYHHITILNGRQGAALSHSLLARPCRTTWVRTFLISTKLGEEDGLGRLPPFIARMTNLQDLRLETPDCNKVEPSDRVGWISLQGRYERVFEGASVLFPNKALRHLPGLQSCTIHFVDESKEIYSMTKYSALFIHPTLKDLTISCASTDFPGNMFKTFQEDASLMKSTNLESLHLEECDILPQTLAILLSFPRNLKSLRISEGIRYDTFGGGNSRHHGNACPGALSDAIAEHCAESLESLSLALGHVRLRSRAITQYGQHLNLTPFENLKYLELDYRTFYLIRPKSMCDHATWRRLPESLETFRVFSLPLGHRLGPSNRALGTTSFPFDVCMFREKAKHGVPNLKRMICCYDYYKGDDIQALVVSDDGETVESLSPVTLAKARVVRDSLHLQPIFKRSGVRLEVETTVLPDGFIPPFLYPEERPYTGALWQSSPS